MTDPQQVLEIIKNGKVLPLFYHDDVETCKGVLRALYAGGVRVVEFTNRGRAALENFAALKKLRDEEMPDLVLGIGTILNATNAMAFISAGAEFVVCPNINEQVSRATHDAGLLWIPGCLTPTEISRAADAGASLVKIFPGSLLGPGYVKSLLEIFPAVQFMPTGGVEATRDNLQQWADAGVVAVGLGSKLVSKELMDRQDFAAIGRNAESAVRLITSVFNN